MVLDLGVLFARRIDEVMTFEKFKADVKARTKDWPSLTEIFGGSARGRARR